MRFEGWVSSKKLFKLLSGMVQGNVLAVFRSGIYLDICGETILLHDKKNGYLPFGIAIDDFSGKGRELGLEPDMEIACSNGVLLCCGMDFRIKIHLAEQNQMSCTNDPLPAFARNLASCTELRQRSSLGIFATCDLASIDREAIEDIFARAAYKGLAMLVDALNSYSAELMENALNSLLGLGRGLTPSLDDFLCGTVFTMHYAEHFLGYNQPYLDTLSDAMINKAPTRTNVYSCAYLLSAASGEDFSLLRDCIENSGNPSFLDYLQRMFNIGSSSGADMLSGMCFAANYILKQRNFTV